MNESIQLSIKRIKELGPCSMMLHNDALKLAEYIEQNETVDDLAEDPDYQRFAAEQATFCRCNSTENQCSDRSMLLEITKEELDAVATVIAHTVCGDPVGPRRHVESLRRKLLALDADEYRYHTDPDDANLMLFEFDHRDEIKIAETPE